MSFIFLYAIAMAPIKTVFLSSTTRDLHEYREQVARAIDSLDGWKCIHMEDFGARESLPGDYCGQEVVACDLFIGIVGLCYGSCPVGSEKSFTVLEYEAAMQANKDRLMFLASSDFSLPGNLIESDALRDRQREFRRRIENELYGTFESVDNLVARVVTAIANWEKSRGISEKNEYAKLEQLLAEPETRKKGYAILFYMMASNLKQVFLEYKVLPPEIRKEYAKSIAAFISLILNDLGTNQASDYCLSIGDAIQATPEYEIQEIFLKALIEILHNFPKVSSDNQVRTASQYLMDICDAQFSRLSDELQTSALYAMKILGMFGWDPIWDWMQDRVNWASQILGYFEYVRSGKRDPALKESEQILKEFFQKFPDALTTARSQIEKNLKTLNDTAAKQAKWMIPKNSNE